MAAGDFVLFEEFAAQLGAENHIFANGGDTFKFGIVDNTLIPLAGDATPVWADYSANEVGTGGGYVAGGITLANQSYVEAAGVGKFDADDLSLAQNASGFTDGYWGILYNDTNVGKMAIGFMDLGGPLSEVAGSIAVTWNAAGTLTITVT